MPEVKSGGHGFVKIESRFGSAVEIEIGV